MVKQLQMLLIWSIGNTISKHAVASDCFLMVKIQNKKEKNTLNWHCIFLFQTMLLLFCFAECTRAANLLPFLYQFKKAFYCNVVTNSRHSVPWKISFSNMCQNRTFAFPLTPHVIVTLGPDTFLPFAIFPMNSRSLCIWQYLNQVLCD